MGEWTYKRYWLHFVMIGCIHEYNAVGLSHGDLPKSVDWGEKGVVTVVKNQGDCMSCWAFSKIAAVEGLHKIEIGQLISLSEQELIDDSSVDGCHVRGRVEDALEFIIKNGVVNSGTHCNSSIDGCQVGGRVEDAAGVEFIIKNGVVNSGTQYPYKLRYGECRDRKHKIKHSKMVVSIDGYERVPANDEKTLQRIVAHQPVIIGIVASNDFVNYQSDVFTGGCGTKLNHGAIIIGYGTDNENGMDYWIVKNSWGSGEPNGYIRIQRNFAHNNDSGMCGIAKKPSYPTMKSNAPLLPFCLHADFISKVVIAYIIVYIRHHVLDFQTLD